MASQYASEPIHGNTTRPPVSIQTFDRPANAVVSERNTASARKDLSSGTVPSQNRRQGLSHSSRAYSNSSGGIALSPASRKIPVKAPPRQMLNSATLANAYAPEPKMSSTACLRLPATRLYEVISGGFNVQYQPMTATLAG